MEDNTLVFSWVVMAVTLLIVLIVVGSWGCPHYRVWQQGLEGQAELARAEQNRKIKVAEALAARESAVQLAQAEVERARGVAEANKIIGDSLRNNEDYLRYLWIHNLEVAEGKGASIIYVPTEANLPILEASRPSRRGEAE